MQRHTWLDEKSVRDPTLAEALRKAQARSGCSSSTARDTDTAEHGRAEGRRERGRVGRGAGARRGGRAGDGAGDARALRAASRAARSACGCSIDGRLERQKTVDARRRARPSSRSVPGRHVRAGRARTSCRSRPTATRWTSTTGAQAAVDVEREVKALCVNGSPSSDLASNETYFLERALAPQQFEFAAGAVGVLGRDRERPRLRHAQPQRLPSRRAGQRLPGAAREDGAARRVRPPRRRAHHLPRRPDGDVGVERSRCGAGGTGLLPARILERKSYPAEGSECQRFDARLASHEIVRTLRGPQRRPRPRAGAGVLLSRSARGRPGRSRALPLRQPAARVPRRSRRSSDRDAWCS